MSIVFPASSSDLLAFEGSSLYQRLQDRNFLAPNLLLSFFGDNAYLNSPYMATPHPGSVSGVKDAYNFYHSRCCIQVECAFGMLKERWGIVRSAMPRSITICKTIALVYSLARLLNFCIQQNDSVNVAQSLFSDELHDRIPSTTPGAEPPRDARDSGSARSHSTHLETSSSDRP